MVKSPYNKVASDAFNALQLDAGMLLSNFDFANPYAEPADADILATTTGGINAVCEPTYEDLGEDVDNVPNNTKELLMLTGWNCRVEFTSIKFNATNAAWALGAADEIDAPTGAPTGTVRIVPRAGVKQTDFKNLYAAFPMADGGIYVKMVKNALSTGGMNVQTSKNGKGTNKMTITGYISINDQDTMPMEDVFIPPLTLLTVVSAAGTTTGKTAITVTGHSLGTGETYVYKISTSEISVDVGDSTTAWTSWDGTAEITAETGKIITVAVAKSSKVVTYGSTTVTAKAGT